MVKPWIFGYAILIGFCLSNSVHSADLSESDREQIEKSASQFLDAYNERNLDALVDLFSEQAEVLSLDEEPTEGKDALRARFQAGFEAMPGAKISLKMENLRAITNDVAFEDGFTITFADGETPTTRTRYSVVHVKRDKKWKINLIRELQEENLSPYARLRDLEWMLGDWVDEGSDANVKTTCRWDEKKSFLLRDFELETRNGETLKGTQRIGLDPVTKQIRSWTFDDAGGLGEATWTQVEDRWVLKSTGARPDGKTASATQIITPLSKDRHEWKTISRILGDEALEPVTVILVRRSDVPNQPTVE